MGTFNLNEVTLTAKIVDVSTAGQVYIPVPDDYAGDIVEIRSAIDGAIGTADVDFTAKIGGTAVTDGVITVAYSGSAAGDVDVTRPTAARTVRGGDAIEIETDGASTNTVAAEIVVVIKR
jgi:hypothetical protein